MKERILWNALWNAVNGSSGAIVAILVPPFLTRQLSPEAYGAWALALQIGAYVNLFGFGLQVAVARYVAQFEAAGRLDERDGIVATAFWFLAVACLFGWLALCAVGLTIDRLVPDLSPALLGETRAAIITVSFALAVNLLSAIFAAVFMGRQQSHIPATIQGLGRLTLAAGLIIAGFSGSLAVLGTVYALISVLTVAALWYAWRTRTPEPRLSPRLASGRQGRELAGFCFSLTIWNLAMLLVGGLDLIIVGRFDYPAVPYFAVCVTLVTFGTGTLVALANAIVPAVAAQQGSGAQGDVRAALISGTRLAQIASIMLFAPLILVPGALLQLWVGPDYAVRAAPIAALLGIAAFIRASMLTYVAVATGTGLQRRMLYTPLIEGLIAVVAAILLAGLFGAIGVAWAKCIAGVIGVALLIGQHALREAAPTLGRWQFVGSGLLRPLVAWIPLLILAAIFHCLDLSATWRLLLLLPAIPAAGWLLGLTRSERDAVRRRLPFLERMRWA